MSSSIPGVQTDVDPIPVVAYVGDVKHRRKDATQTTTGELKSTDDRDNYLSDSSTLEHNGGHSGSVPNPFQDPVVAARWKNVYEMAEYEARHVFDEELSWSKEEERKLVRKLDWHVCLWACIMFFSLQVDRNNLKQAVSDNMLDDLGMTTDDYNTGNTVFLLSFLLAELPSQLVSKAIGPDRWIPMQICLWSLVAMFQCFLDGRGSFLATRALLGILEIGVASFFMMPASAVQTKTWFRPNGWFTPREEAIVVNRVLRDDPSKGDMHNRQAITPKRLWASMKDYDLWPLYIIGSIGFDSFTTNLLTIPANVTHIISLILITRLADWLDQRALVSMLQAIWTLPCIIALRWWPGLVDQAWPTYAIITVLLSYPYCHAIVVAWTSRNSNNVGTRSVSSALYNMSVQLGNIASSFIYRDDDKPYYHRGNTQLFAINIAAIIVFLLTKVYYDYRNKQRDLVWNAMTQEERENYTRNTTLEGSRRLDFRFAT
ncbi:hypothetical protein SLS62_000350 [Diatrype stigma]|uniref:Allantoate permease n=1 Tax=Diatrype stigma TaxID=117547 RepID=A0AAN9YSG3_9PEZI